ncbi:MAG: ankyrin repeat domain-containing protein [Bacteroidales bacterium]|nr:ankyrin repeat domain-containing protein [Bacteroidales bacterium]
MKLVFNLLFMLALVFACNSTFAQKRSKLHEPASKGDLEAVRKIIDKGGKVDKKDIAGQTPLMYAAESGSLEVVMYLVENGADVNAVSGKQGRGTPLIYAAATNQLEVVKYLLENDANINLTTPYQNETALMWAVAMGFTEVVKLLVEKGADQKITNRDGENVMDVAKKLHREDMVQLLAGK